MIQRTSGKTTANAVKTLKSKGQHRRNAAVGEICEDKSYTLRTFCDHLGCTASAVIEMRKRGLKARWDGGRLMINGRDYLEYVANLPVAELKKRVPAET